MANFLPNSLETYHGNGLAFTASVCVAHSGGRHTFFRSKPKASRPETAVTDLRLLRSILLMVMMLRASLSACFCSAASALAVFFCASLAARFCASTERDAVAASSASV